VTTRRQGAGPALLWISVNCVARGRRTRRDPASTEAQQTPGGAVEATNRYGGVGGWRRRFASALRSFAASRSSLAARRCSAARSRYSSESPWPPSASCACNEAARSCTAAEDSSAVAASSAATTAACRARSTFARATCSCSTPEPRISLIWASSSTRRCASAAMRSPSSSARRRASARRPSLRAAPSSVTLVSVAVAAPADPQASGRPPAGRASALRAGEGLRVPGYSRWAPAPPPMCALSRLMLRYICPARRVSEAASGGSRPVRPSGSQSYGESAYR
jgi:hypothetical protein